jgi:hypothetical protein
MKYSPLRYLIEDGSMDVMLPAAAAFQAINMEIATIALRMKPPVLRVEKRTFTWCPTFRWTDVQAETNLRRRRTLWSKGRPLE